MRFWAWGSWVSWRRLWYGLGNKRIRKTEKWSGDYILGFLSFILVYGFSNKELYVVYFGRYLIILFDFYGKFVRWFVSFLFCSRGNWRFVKKEKLVCLRYAVRKGGYWSLNIELFFVSLIVFVFCGLFLFIVLKLGRRLGGGISRRVDLRGCYV